VADFGVARFQDQGGVMTAETGTYRWMAPEVHLYFLVINLTLVRNSVLNAHSSVFKV
jgi:hypothetical protein